MRRTVLLLSSFLSMWLLMLVLQFHSIDSNEEFGIGNMGLVGMAKFFRTYHYNPLCEWIGIFHFCIVKASSLSHCGIRLCIP